MSAAVLTAEQVGFRYADVPVLHDVNLSVEAGRVLALTGANGTGKSTLLHLLAGVTQPTSGRVSRRAGTRLALLPQRTSDIDALPLTVTECVQIARFTPRRWLSRDDRAHVAEVMRRLDIVHLARRRLRELSGGQRQRTLIAQALAQDADIYILDEPTAALDTHCRSVSTTCSWNASPTARRWSSPATIPPRPGSPNTPSISDAARPATRPRCRRMLDDRRLRVTTSEGRQSGGVSGEGFRRCGG
ncbi:metal ABC transporter ATP-binding protein [Salinispora arenicola]|uniref:metal ABC transporter ATP-binding protein n=1 Tax=Salinispora arenicola TaxID=168697 RepID=UPI0027DC1CC4|nr:ATP-binding cassette domain-containing protein [Salinispora arenicola]